MLKINWLLTTVHTHTPHPSKERALGRKLRDCLLYPETGVGRNTSKKFKASSLGNPAFGGGGGQVREWQRRRPEAQGWARCSLQAFSQDQTPDAEVWVLTSPPPRHPQPRSSGFPARPREAPARGGRRRGGWHFLAGPRVASLAPGHSDSALTDRHQMLFRAALRSARRFRFSIDRRKPGRGESVDVTSPQPLAMAARRSESGAS